MCDCLLKKKKMSDEKCLSAWQLKISSWYSVPLFRGWQKIYSKIMTFKFYWGKRKKVSPIFHDCDVTLKCCHTCNTKCALIKSQHLSKRFIRLIFANNFNFECFRVCFSFSQIMQISNYWNCTLQIYDRNYSNKFIKFHFFQVSVT